jgi:hypothetical protein
LKYANKDIKWGFTWEARVACAVLDRNVPNWKFQIFDKLHLPRLDPVLRKELEGEEAARLDRKKQYQSEGHMLKKRAARKAERDSNAEAAKVPKSGYRGRPRSTSTSSQRKKEPERISAGHS